VWLVPGPGEEGGALTLVSEVSGLLNQWVEAIPQVETPSQLFIFNLLLANGVSIQSLVGGWLPSHDVTHIRDFRLECLDGLDAHAFLQGVGGR